MCFGLSSNQLPGALAISLVNITKSADGTPIPEGFCLEQALRATCSKMAACNPSSLGSTPEELLYGGNLRSSVDALPHGGNMLQARKANDRRALRKLAKLKAESEQKRNREAKAALGRHL